MILHEIPAEGRRNDTLVYYMDDMQEIIDIGEYTANLTDSEQRQRRSSLTANQKFTGTATMEEAVDLARNGWPEGTRLLKDAADQLEVPPVLGDTVLPEAYYDVTGSDVDVSRYLSGEPENMMQYTFPRAPLGNTVELVVECSQSSSTPTETIMRRGAAILAAVEAMQAQGYSTGVTVAAHVINNARNLEVSHVVPIVKPGEFVDSDALAFALAHPSWLRRFVFAASEVASRRIRERMGYYKGGNYGLPRAMSIFATNGEYPMVPISATEAGEGGVTAAQKLVDKIAARLEYLRENPMEEITPARSKRRDLTSQ